MNRPPTPRIAVLAPALTGKTYTARRSLERFPSLLVHDEDAICETGTMGRVASHRSGPLYHRWLANGTSRLLAYASDPRQPVLLCADPDRKSVV